MISTWRPLQALGMLLPLGALGVSAALAATPAKPMVLTDGANVARPGVAERLHAIRNAVSKITADQAGLQPGDPNIQKAWWGNWHRRFWGPRWGNWHPGLWANWHPGWGNGGWNNWHNGWGNGGWNNFWRNW